MNTFDFQNGSFQFDSSNAGSTARPGISFSDDNVNFTFSTSAFGSVNPSGADRVYMAQNGGAGAGSVGVAYSGSGTFTGWEFTLDAAGGAGAMDDGTQFGGNIALGLRFGGSGGQVDLKIIFDGASPVTRTLSNNGSGFDTVITAVGQFSSIRFVLSSEAAFTNLQITSLTAEINCFCAGTLIATPTGDRAVEDLSVGDVISIADGGTTRVRWVGQQTVRSAISDPAVIHPICISAGAIGPGVPARDLWLSRDHAVEMDGILYTAGALVNGDTIYQVAEMPASFTYYHVETDAHDLILAEGLPAESFIDYLVEGSFDNAAQRDARVIAEMDLPRVSSARMVPGPVAGKVVDPLTSRPY